MRQLRHTVDLLFLAAAFFVRLAELPVTFVGEASWAWRHSQPSPWRLGAKAVACGWWEACCYWQVGRDLIREVNASTGVRAFRKDRDSQDRDSQDPTWGPPL
jgi:hypothetical protein